MKKNLIVVWPNWSGLDQMENGRKKTDIAMSCSTLGAWIALYFLFHELHHVTASIERNQPHIIVIIADDMGQNDVSYHGSNQIPTPNIDALAYNGVTLRNSYVLPTCSPSRSSFLTGKYAMKIGMQDRPLGVGEAYGIPLNFTLFPEYFRNLGYKTHIVGKWHVGYYAEPFLPTSRGFDDFFGYYNGYITYRSYMISDNIENFPGYDLHRDVEKNHTVDWTRKNVYATDLFTEEAENIIANHNSEIPLYLHFAHLAVHAPGVGDKLEVRNIDQVNEKFGYIEDESRRLYAGMVSAMDESIGRVVEALNKKGMLDNSIIVFTSDNGAPSVGPLANYGSNYPYRGEKGSVFEGGIHVPAFVWSPMIENTSRVHADYFHITDWLPTLYNLAGGNIEDLGSIDGVDQWDSISKGIPSTRDSLLLNIDEPSNTSAAIKRSFKYLTGSADNAYGAYLGDNVSDGDLSAPPYNVTSVMNSMAAIAISNTNGSVTIGKENILMLRSANTIACRPHTDEPSNCTSSCLFDIKNDPCETTDVSDQYPEVVKELQDFIADYQKVLIPQPGCTEDLRALPDCEGGPWRPWLTVDGEPLPRPLAIDQSCSDIASAT